MGRLKCQCNIKNCKIVTFTSSSFILLFLRFPDISSQFNSSKPESKTLPHNSQSPLPHIISIPSSQPTSSHSPSHPNKHKPPPTTPNPPPAPQSQNTSAAPQKPPAY